MSDWESRMAAKAAMRAQQARIVREAELIAEDAAWHTEHDQTVEQYVDELAAEMTDADAEASLSSAIACACTGAPSELPYGSPCRCALWGMAVRQKLDGKP